jgi:hypothetical protein
MSTKLPLRNDWDIHRDEVKSRGVLQTGLTPRGFISATPYGAAIDPSLEVNLTELAAGEYIGTIQGTALSNILTPLLDAAELAGVPLKVYERVVVDTQDYDDYLELTVVRARKARTA